MDDHSEEEILQEFGKRIQRCYGCFIAYHLKDMYLGEDVTFFCEHCKDETMFHFNEFSKLLDLSKLNEVTGEHHHWAKICEAMSRCHPSGVSFSVLRSLS